MTTSMNRVTGGFQAMQKAMSRYGTEKQIKRLDGATMERLRKNLPRDILDRIGLEFVRINGGEMIFQGVEGVKYESRMFQTTPVTIDHFSTLTSLAEEAMFLIVPNFEAKIRLALFAVDPKIQNEADKKQCPMIGLVNPQEMDLAALLGCTLPNSIIWERAAAGENGQTYPWGNADPAGRIVRDSLGTMPVKSYPNGASGEGIFSLVDNVSERLSHPLNAFNPQNSDHKEDVDDIEIRGANWISDGNKQFTAQYQNHEGSANWSLLVGFRLVKPIL